MDITHSLRIFGKKLISAVAIAAGLLSLAGCAISLDSSRSSSETDSIKVESITVKSESSYVGIGATITVSADVLPANASKRDVSWTGNNFVTIKDNYDGTVDVTGVKAGSVDISAMAKDGSGTSGFLCITVAEKATLTYVDETNSLKTLNSCYIGQVLEENDYTPVKDNYTFVEWYANASLTEPVVYPYTLKASNIFYAKWVSNETDVTVTFNANGGTEIDAYTGKAGSVYTLPNPEKDGYTFGGWYITEDLSGSVVSSSYTLSKDITLYAKWTENSKVISVTAVSFTDKAITMLVDDSAVPAYTITPADATNRNITLSSNNEDAAYIQNGRIIGKASGTAVITITTADGNKTDTCTVTVNEYIAVTGVTLNSSSVTISKGGTKQLSASIQPSNASNTKVSWATDDRLVATVSSAGVVKAVGVGDATITVSTEDGNITAQCSVTVTEPTNLILHAYDYCNVYIWETSDDSINKQHFDMTQEGTGSWYTKTFNVSSASLIFTKSSGGWSSQTTNLSRTEPGEWWYKNGVWTSYNPDRPATPVIKASVKAGTYLSAQSVTLTGSNSDDIIYYTLDGSTPGPNSVEYKGAIEISSTVTLKAIGYNSSAAVPWGDVAEFAYVIDPDADIEAPVITPGMDPGRYSEAISVSFTISDNKGSSGLKAYYTTDGTAVSSSSAVYTSGTAIAVPMDGNVTVNILAVDAAGNKTTGSYYYSVGTTPQATRFDPRQESIYFLLTARWFDGDAANTIGDEWCSSEEDPTWRGDFKGLVEKMDYIKALGFTCIWITPVVQNRGPLCYHGYHAWDMYREDARLESPGYDFQRVIDEAHSRGMKICLDVVLQHSGRYGLRDFAEIKYARDPKMYPTPEGWESFTYDEDAYQANNSKYNAASVQSYPNDWKYDGLTSPGKYPAGHENAGQDIPPNVDFVGNVRPFNSTDLERYSYLNTSVNGAGFLKFQWPTTESYQLTLDGMSYPASGDYTYDDYCGMPKLHFHGHANGFNDSGMFDTYPAANLRSIHEDCPDLNTESKEVQEYVLGAYKRYIKMGVDMFRVDTLMHIDKKTVNDVFWPEFFETAASSEAETARGNGDFFVFGEVANFVCNFADKPAPLRQSNYTWDNTVEGPDSTDYCNNALLDGNSYRTPDYSHKAVPGSDYHVSTIDIVSHNNFCNGPSGAYGKALETSGAYNDATYLTWYTDSHDYGPNKSETRWQGDFAAAWSMMFTFRGIPIVYYGSEIKFAAGKPNDWPGSTSNTINETGRAYYGDNLAGTVTASDFGEYTASGAVSETLSAELSQHLIGLNKIRLAVPALQMGQYSTSGHSGGWAGYKRRYTGTNKITGEAIDSYVLVGVGEGTHSWTGVLNGTYVDCVTGNTITASGGSCSFTVSNGGDAGLGVYVLQGLATAAPGKIDQNSPYLK